MALAHALPSSIHSLLSRRALLALLALLAACGKPAAQTAAKEASAGPLVELLPPGPSPLVVVRPRALFQHEAVRLLWSTLVSAEDERAFVERTGVDPRKLEELVVFELADAGYVALARGEFIARQVVERAAERLVLLDVQTDEPVLRREGPAGSARYAYAELDGHALLVAKNASPQLVAAILARRADRSLPRVFDGADAAALYARHEAATCALYAPRPLGLELGSGAALLLSEERALVAVAQPEDGFFRIAIELRGDFPPGAEDNFSRLVTSVAHAPLGQLLGLGEVERELWVVKQPEAVQITFHWPAQRLALGLRSIFMDDLHDLIR
jgi:hypothetical protein